MAPYICAMQYANKVIIVRRDELCIQATANPVIKGVVVRGANVLPQKEIEDAFKHQFGRTLNFPQFSGALKRLNKWYEDRGIFGQVGCPAQMNLVGQVAITNGGCKSALSSGERPMHLPSNRMVGHYAHQLCTYR